jgi:hypothetical protein
MRNIWYPNKRAEYVTAARLKSIGTKDVAPEWDAASGSGKEAETEREAEKEKEKRKKKAAPPPLEAEPVKPIELDLLSVRSSMSSL